MLLVCLALPLWLTTSSVPTSMPASLSDAPVDSTSAAPAEPPPEPAAAAAEPDIWSILDEQREASETVVAVTKTAQTLAETPASVSVISAAEIEARGYRSVAEAVRSMPGVVSVDDQILPDVSMRGVTGGLRSWSSTIKVMIDGQATSFRPDTTNFLGPELIPIELVERIEVIRGPVSALYGANAFLGVINIVTKKAADRWSLAYRLSGFLANDRNPGGAGSLTASATLGRLKLVAGLAGDYFNASGLRVERTYPAQTDGLSPQVVSQNDRKVPKSFFASFVLDAGSAGTFILDGNLQHLDTYAEFSDWSIGTHRNRLSIMNGFARLRWEKALNDRMTLSAFGALHAGGDLPNSRLAVNFSDSLFQRDLSNVEISLGSEYAWRFREQDRWSIGVDFATDGQRRLRYIEILGSPRGAEPAGARIAPDSPETLRYNNVGAHTQLLVAPLSWLQAIGGFRFDYNSAYGAGYSPRAGVVVRPLPWLSLKALYGRSFKAPSGVQLQARPALGESDVAGNPGLKPQIGDTLELIASVKPIAWLELNVTGFALWVSQQITFQRFALRLQARNTDRVASYGVEGEVKVRTRRVDAFFHATYAHAVAQSASDVTLGVERRFPGAPSWWLGAGAQLRVPEIHLQLYAELRAMGDRLSSGENTRKNLLDPYTLPPYAVVDVSLSTLDLKLAGTAIRAMLRVQNMIGSGFNTIGYGGIDAPNLRRVFELVIAQSF